MNILELSVYPSKETCIAVRPDEIYGGAHYYEFRNSIGFHEGTTQFEQSHQSIQFIHKADDGTITPGVLSEQLVLALIDRHEKLNARFPSPQNAKMLEHLKGFMDACEERVNARMQAGVMGELKNIPEQEDEQPAGLADGLGDLPSLDPDSKNLKAEVIPPAAFENTDDGELNHYHITILKSALKGEPFSYPEDQKEPWDKATEYLLKECYLTPVRKGPATISNKGLTALKNLEADA